MQSFISLFISELLKENSDLSGDCVVFPTRRAGLIFKKKFSEQLTKPAFLPAVYSIDDFISALSPYKVAEATHLVIELFTVYKNHFKDITFEQFMPWGEMLLKDFNEVDLHMVNAEKLYAQVLSLKEIDLLVGVNEEETQRIRDFWKLFSNQEISSLKTAFLDNWSKLPVIYKEFKTQLNQKGMAYSGMAARAVADRLKNSTVSVPWKKIYFEGFYALSNAEKNIFNFLSDSEKAIIHWDADHYYLDDKNQEAGKYLRKKQINNQPEEFKWTFDYFKNEERDIHLIGVPLHIGQAKYMGLLLDNLHDELMPFDQTAVVLPDEKLLMPVLYSLPQKTESINVTMGYPLQGTMLEQLIRDLKTITGQKKQDKSETLFLKQDIIALFENNFFYKLHPAGIRDMLWKLKKEKSYSVNALFFNDENTSPVILKIISVLQNNIGATHVLSEVLFLLLEYYHKNKNAISILEYSLLKFFYDELLSLSKIIDLYQPSIEFKEETIWKLILELLKSLRVPFTGEPVKGLQIMGFLETRNLDFENLFILSVNEDVMPGSQTGNSYIPYSIRKAYGLPTFEDQDAIYAYHFYRLLQRAKNTYLFYNTETGGSSGGEMSRYILQIAYELKKKYPDKVNLTHQLAGTDLQRTDIKSISIKKEGAAYDELMDMFLSTGPKRRKWSATAFSAYINCSLQFYFKYVAGIKDPDEIKDEIDPAVFGNIIHLVMESFYKDQKTITNNYIDSLKVLVDSSVESAIRGEFPASPDKLTGKNSLLKTVMVDLISKILAHDKEETPFEIIGLENKFEYELNFKENTISLYGKIDRIDEKNDVIRIIDYKTGKDKTKKNFAIEDLFQNTDQKATFQLLMYSLLYKNQNPQSKIKAGIFGMRSFANGIDFLNEGAEVNNDQLGAFENYLTTLITEILNPDVDFSQTADEKRCVYCTYKEICNR